MADKSVSQPSRRRSLFHRQEGQAALEFLLVLPFCIMFILLLVDFGLMMYEYVSISNSVREGARYGSVNCGDGSCSADINDPTSVQRRTINRSGGILTFPLPPGDVVTVLWVDNSGGASPSPSDKGDSVVVKVDHLYDFLFLPSPFAVTLGACADMSLEQWDLTLGLPEGTGCPP